jgi:hypothetical protein
MSEVLLRVAREFDIVAVKVTADGDRRLERCDREGLCTACLNKIPAGAKSVRGQCMTCYPNTMKKIAAKKVSENQLIREGKIKKAGRPGRKPVNDYTRELAEM